MAIDDKVGKWELLGDLTGSKHVNPGRQDVVISSRMVDFAYLEVKKMQRSYNRKGNTESDYYAPAFSKVDEAYLSMDIDAFNEAINELISQIDMD